MKDQFTFKQFTIRQDLCAMKVGTDGVLLGSWATGGEKILDIGTGTGLIALMMAQRFTNAQIDCIDIDVSACTQANDNIKKSCFAERINVYNFDLQDYEPSYLYNSIVCNPPFFVNSLKCPDIKRTLARHTFSLSPQALFCHSYRLLTSEGFISIIIPTEQADSFLDEAHINGFFVHKKTFVKTTEKKKAKRILITFGKQQPKFRQEDSQVLITGDKRSVWYNDLTSEFYL